jgi:hypothetical protein
MVQPITQSLSTQSWMGMNAEFPVSKLEINLTNLNNEGTGFSDLAQALPPGRTKSPLQEIG